ncbi:transcription termination factor 3, mitochondrial-like [Babylonia areolata]|uniref:transcription termination factor 3, mitochondrial-like n=1 Tax=Babylonia areolata TaxID=304850 RepID=UPI003FD1E4AB
MAMLLFPCARPLTCRTAAVLRVINTSLPVSTLCTTSMKPHVLYMPVASKSPSAVSRTVSRLLLSQEFAAVVRPGSGCFCSQCSDKSFPALDRASKPDPQRTEGSQAVLKNTSSPSENGCVEESDRHRNQNECSEKGQTEILSVSQLQQSHSPHGSSSNVSQVHQQEEDVSLVDLSRSNIDHTSHEQTPVMVMNPPPPVSDQHTGATSVPQSIGEADLQELLPPRPIHPSFNLAPYLAQSPLLQRLVALGVDLSVLEKVKEAADYLVQADWAADIQPRLLFLQDLGVGDAQLGRVLTKSPLLLKEDIEDMQGRINYLESKKFSREQIIRIVTSAPLTLMLPVTYLDKKLGFLQKMFHLTGDEVRLTAAKLPKIIPWKLQKLKDTRFYVKEMLGFSDRELKAMLLAAPKVFLSDRHQLGKRFDLLHNVMGLTHQHLAAWPAVLRTRRHIVEQRHRFLVLVGRAQYDPRRENYVSLKALVSGRDRDFCHHVAKTSPAQFYDFLKSL